MAESTNTLVDIAIFVFIIAIIIVLTKSVLIFNPAVKAAYMNKISLSLSSWPRKFRNRTAAHSTRDNIASYTKRTSMFEVRYFDAEG